MLSAQQIYGSGAPVAANLGEVSLGRDLKRLLPEDRFDARPLRGAGGRLTMVADARLDNRPELAAALGIATDLLATMSDSDVLLAAYEKWGEACCAHLSGAFAFVVWDADARRFVMARDAVGHRPLHYFHAARLAAFASMPKGLLALREIERAPDMTFVAQGLSDVSWEGDRSYFANISRVRPGHFAVLDREGARQYRYWDPDLVPVRLRSHEEYAEAVGERLDRAVARQMRGLDSVATHLSAGLDSAAVTTSAAIQLGDAGRVTAYTAVPHAGYSESVPGRIVDEGRHAASVAALYANIDHKTVAAETRSLLDHLHETAHLFDQPCPNLCNMGWMAAINERARSDGHAVLLTGTHGNIGFSYDGSGWSGELLRQRRWLALLRHLTAVARAGWKPVRSELREAITAVSPGLRRALTAWRGGVGYPFIAAHADLRRRRPDAASWHQSLMTAARKKWFDRIDLGNANQGMLGGWGIDWRDPTADRELLELCLAIPAGTYLHRGVPRALARSVLAGRVPPQILDERSKGLQAADWHEALERDRPRLAEAVEVLGQTESLSGILDTDRLARLVENWPRGRWNDPRTSHAYRAALLRGIAMGDFVRRASGANR